jgi:hypothetical protein
MFLTSTGHAYNSDFRSENRSNSMIILEKRSIFERVKNQIDIVT